MFSPYRRAFVLLLLALALVPSQRTVAICNQIAAYAHELQSNQNAPLPAEIRSAFSRSDLRAFHQLPVERRLATVEGWFIRSVESNLQGIARGIGSYDHALASTRRAIGAFPFPRQEIPVARGGLKFHVYADRQLTHDFTRGRGIVYNEGDTVTIRILATSEDSALVRLAYGQGQIDTKSFVGWVNLGF